MAANWKRVKKMEDRGIPQAWSNHKNNQRGGLGGPVLIEDGKLTMKVGVCAWGNFRFEYFVNGEPVTYTEFLEAA